MSVTAADFFGMSRAIIVNDKLVKRLQQLDVLEQSYRQLVEHTERVIRAFGALTRSFKRTYFPTIIINMQIVGSVNFVSLFI